jgi:hypothetical protein
MKAYWGSGVIAPRILDLGTRWGRVVSFTPRPLYPQEKSPWYLLDRRLGGPQSRSGGSGEVKNSQPLSGLKPPIVQSAAQRYILELSWLLNEIEFKCKYPCFQAPRHEDAWRGAGTAPRIPILGSSITWVVSFTIQPLDRKTLGR